MYTGRVVALTVCVLPRDFFFPPPGRVGTKDAIPVAFGSSGSGLSSSSGGGGGGGYDVEDAGGDRKAGMLELDPRRRIFLHYYNRLIYALVAYFTFTYFGLTKRALKAVYCVSAG